LQTAYYKLQQEDKVEIINSYAVDSYMPDVTFLLKLDPEGGIMRSRKRDELDRLENEKLSFHKKVYEGYLRLEEKYPERICGIDASKSIEEVKKDIYLKLEEILKKNEL
ncbi:MAG: hypothetical protein MJ171_00670, partial [Clostridia bacterium]|nr:hypothetical protein [Clostridia bacterium]